MFLCPFALNLTPKTAEIPIVIHYTYMFDIDVVTGTGEWQEITINVNADNFVGITFVALKAATDTYQHPTVPASEIDIACVAEQE